MRAEDGWVGHFEAADSLPEKVDVLAQALRGLDEATGRLITDALTPLVGTLDALRLHVQEANLRSRLLAARLDVDVEAAVEAELAQMIADRERRLRE